MAFGLKPIRLPGRYLVQARWLLPISSPPIPFGALLIEEGKVAAVGPAREIARFPHEGEVDLGPVAVLPGLINAHCHLDYTDMAGQIDPVKLFSDWIKAMLALKAHRGYSDYALSWLRGARMLLDSGVTTVADIEAVPELLPEVLSATPLRVCSLLEMTGVRSRRLPADILQDAGDRIAQLPGCWTGLSPHAPYSTTPELLRLAGLAARERGLLVAVHVSESAEEFEMYASGSGSMYDWLRPQRDMADCGQGSPVGCLHRQGLLGPNLLAVHANYLAPGDADLLAKSETNVVHCPRSHDYFKHAPFPFAQLRAAGVNLCLGTDSLATARLHGKKPLALDLFAEMRLFSRRHPEVAPDQIVNMVTRNPAKALGRAGKLGEFAPGARADLIAVPVSAKRDPLEAVVHHAGPVTAVMMDGNWVIPPHV